MRLVYNRVCNCPVVPAVLIGRLQLNLTGPRFGIEFRDANRKNLRCTNRNRGLVFNPRLCVSVHNKRSLSFTESYGVRRFRYRSNKLLRRRALIQRSARYLAHCVECLNGHLGISRDCLLCSFHSHLRVALPTAKAG